ncbi:MAG: hypothetical protein MJB57_18100 [Gemmatimonadetes bacterium]|nr:hypothetical protein [Gemmatimonadota bacterium]
MGEMTWVLSIEEQDGAISGKAETDMGAVALEGVQMGDEVDFLIAVDAPDHAVDLIFNGTLAGDQAEGAVDIMGEFFAWTASLISHTTADSSDSHI